MSDTFHSFDDGRGLRRVFVNGNEIQRVIWADTKRGVLEFYPDPPRIHKSRRDEIYTRKLRGTVTVEYIE